jgi:hypothetical protein
MIGCERRTLAYPPLPSFDLARQPTAFPPAGFINNRLLATVCTLALSLAGCQTPATKIETKEVLVPVATRPIKPDQVPTAPAPLPKRPSSLSAAADVLLADHCSWVAFGLKVMPLLQVSAGMPITPLPVYPECER